jgi:hypothetical protein
MQVTQINIERLVEAEWNANVVPPGRLDKIRRSIEQFGLVENLVARPHPEQPDCFEVLSGNRRLRLLKELGYERLPVVVVELDDVRARLLAQTLNRTRGVHHPKKYAQLLETVLARMAVADVTALLPETEATIDAVLRDFGSTAADRGSAESAEEPPTEPRSRVGEIYELGGHRLACGDATDPQLIAELLAGEVPRLLVTDPPYVVRLDHGWRDGVRQPSGSARAGEILNDDRADWAEVYQLIEAPVAYVWHSALHAHVVRDGLVAAGFEPRQQIVWTKKVHTLFGRDQGGAGTGERIDDQLAGGGVVEDRPLEELERLLGRMRRHRILPLAVAEGHDRRRGLPDGCLFAAALPAGRLAAPHRVPSALVRPLVMAAAAGRRCLAVELDPRWCDVIRNRYAQLTTQTEAV